MPYLTWLADVLRAGGLPVREVDGWRRRGHGAMLDIRGVMLHHTAGLATGDFPSLGVVRDGRPGLAGPLAQLGLGRDGTWYVIAAGQAWHAGTGYVSWCGRDNGNQHLIGVEAESTGRGDWTPAQITSYPQGVSVLLQHVKLGPDRAIGHKEWAPSRKIDPFGWPGDMAGFRATVSEYAEGGFLMALPAWQQERIFNRILSMSQGVPNENHDGAQFQRENAWREQTTAKLDQLLAHLTGGTQRAADAGIGQVTAAQVQAELTNILTEVLGADDRERSALIVAKLNAALSRPTA